MDITEDALICIKIDPQFNIMAMTSNGLSFLGYSSVKELEFQPITVIIPDPSAALHAQIFSECQKTYTNKEKFLGIVKIADRAMNEGTTRPDTRVLTALQNPQSIKSILTSNGNIKSAAIFVDIKPNRFSDLYMYPCDGYVPVSPCSSKKSDDDSSLMLGEMGRVGGGSIATTDAFIEHGKHLQELMGARESIPALTSVLREVKKL
jgi:hypothetical protein